MQQKTSCANFRGSGEHRVINVADPQQTKRRRKSNGNDTSGLPLNHKQSTNGKREVSLSRSAEKWLHVIPLILLLSLFLLGWNYYPAIATVRDGRTTVIRQIHASLPNTTHIDLFIVVVSETPVSSRPQNLSSYDNETSLHLVSAPN